MVPKSPLAWLFSRRRAAVSQARLLQCAKRFRASRVAWWCVPNLSKRLPLCDALLLLRHLFCLRCVPLLLPASGKVAYWSHCRLYSPPVSVQVGPLDAALHRATAAVLGLQGNSDAGTRTLRSLAAAHPSPMLRCVCLALPHHRHLILIEVLI
jgi:hypothetical protein